MTSWLQSQCILMFLKVLQKLIKLNTYQTKELPLLANFSMTTSVLVSQNLFLMLEKHFKVKSLVKLLQDKLLTLRLLTELSVISWLLLSFLNLWTKLTHFLV